ncbi:MAG: hypothetical protein H5T72_10470 [Actinobacteria bacterium]|nr:hypothetical protein [Actinomycetota bacterium]
MLEKARSWSERESVLRAELEGKTLLGQVNITAEDLEILGREIGQELERRKEDDAKRFLSANAPLSIAVFLAWCGIKDYRQGNFWGGVMRRLGMDKVGQSRKNRFQRVLGELFRQALEKNGLEGFPWLAEHGHHYVTPILAHGGIPDYCLGDFFDNLIIPMAQGHYGDDLEDLDAVINAFFEKYRSSFTDVPVRNFLVYGGDIARDLVRRCGMMALRYLEGREVMDPRRVHLPPAVVEAFYEHVKGRSFERGRERQRKALIRPRICLSPRDGSIVLHLREAEVPLAGAQDSGSRRLLYRIRDEEKILHEFQAGVERYLRDRVLLADESVALPGPRKELVVTLLHGHNGEEIDTRRLSFTATAGGEKDAGGPETPYLVFGEEDEEGYCRFMGDTVKATRCWLVKKRDMRVAEEVTALEEVELHEKGWSGYHALKLDTSGTDQLTLKDERGEVLSCVPVRLDLREQLTVRRSGLLPDVTWAGREVYNRPPVLELPAIRDLERFRFEVEDEEGRLLGAYDLGDVVRKKESSLVLDLGELEPFQDSKPGIFRCVLWGKLGERAPLDFAYLPGFEVGFQEENRYPDAEGIASHLEGYIGYPLSMEVRVDNYLNPLPREGVANGMLVRVPPYETSFPIHLRAGDMEATLLVRVPRFNYRLEEAVGGSVKNDFHSPESHQGDTDRGLGAGGEGGLGHVHHTSFKVVRLDDLSRFARLGLFLPRTCQEVKLELEGKDVHSYARGTRKVHFDLGKFISAMESDVSCSFRLVARVSEDGEETLRFPLMVVRKGWTVLNLGREVKGDDLLLRWEEDGSRTLVGEVLLKNLYRPWEEPTSVRVEVGVNSCALPMPGGRWAGGRFALCFRLCDEWDIPVPHLPFQLPPDAHREFFDWEVKTRLGSAEGVTIYQELEMATERLYRDLPETIERRRRITFDGLMDDSPEEQIRAALLTYLYWSSCLGGHHREVEDLLCEAVKDWASAGDREESVERMLRELEEEGGMSVASAAESLRVRLHPDAFECPFYPGQSLRYKPDGRVFRFLEVEMKKIEGKTKPMLKMENVDEPRKREKKRPSSKDCKQCYNFFPLDKHVEFEPWVH